MKKTYQMFLALVALLLLGATNVSAEEISLQDVPFWKHAKFNEPWYPNAPKTTQITPGEDGCAWVIGESTGQPYGDSDVSSFADLSGFDKLIITYTEGKPRVLMNRDYDDGQWDADETKSHLIDNTKSGWSDRYFSIEGNILTVDLKQLVNDKGFAYLHAIKGADWANVTIESMVVTRKGKEKQVGWVNILNNSDLEGDDVSSFITVINGDSGDGDVTYPAVIEDGVGVNNSRGIALKSMENAPQTWSTQLFVHLPEVLPVGTEWRFSMDVISSPDADVSVAGHAAPRSWQCGGTDISEDFANFTTTSEWKTITAKGTINQNLVDKNFQSICFDLNNDKTTATQYYFDNIKFEIYKYGTTAEFLDDNIQVDFGFETNIPELCKTAGKSRVMFPVKNAKVLVNGEEKGITSVEGFADGRFYIFLEETASESDEVRVIYNNAAGDLQLKYAGGPNAGQAIGKVDEIADYNGELLDEYDDIYPYTMLAPTIVKAVPEQGSFNIKNNLKEFYVKFDKKADASKIVAKLDGKALTVKPNEGLAEEFTLTYAGADLTNGLHTINITKVYPEDILSDEVYTDTTYHFCVGTPDASDVPFDLIPVSYFESCAANSVPEGFKLFADGNPAEERVPGGNYGSGARMMEFAAGGDFTRGLYMRTWYLTYGANDEEHVLAMQAGKKYNISFNSCQWAGAGHYMKFQIMKGDEEVYSKVVENNPTLGESRNAVKGSTYTSIDFLPETDGNYVMNWIVAKDAEGTPTENTWQNGVILANVKVSYIPSTFGTVEMLAVTEALDKAKKTQETFADGRYDGAAQTALNEAIAKVEAEKDNYTSPSECTAAVDLLSACDDGLKNHASLCNDYDQKIKDGSDVVRQHTNDKFASLELYAQLVGVVNKYHGVSEMVNEGTEEEPNWQKHYTFDILKDDAALTTAITELTDIVNTTQNMFTTGAPKLETTGVAALVERLRLGAETLKTLGMAEDAYPVAQALNALDDSDELAEELKKFVKAELYGKLKDNTNIFEKIDNSDPENPETKAVSYDMTVFVKNPNLYSPAYSELVPGWDNVTGNAKAWSNWNGNLSHGKNSQFVQDCALHPGWHSKASVEQTITDLPAGIYTIKVRGNDNGTTSDGTYAYAKISTTTPVAEDAEIDMDVNYAGYALVDHDGWDRVIENIVVTDGILTLGFAWGPEAQAFFDEVHVIMTGAANVNYSDLYNEVITNIGETVSSDNKVRAIELYDLNGRRITKAQKGLVIVKKVMSDGTIRTQKVVK